LYKKLKREMTF
nr:Chain E, LEU-TYR-LYS-LYS-LEU-LYS-ARG-GLU-MET-THR-PHE [Influenza A virus (A/chicken/China/028/2014(H7N9))]5WWJ_E Chain E, LEU-TYR-LYS-LYS-LEU-LYS-ARG-GLU-MET-THR-PHE [Influenza A virus (A/chicken/China/028/2014(H7N9))]5WWJ_F Chain F, LEU-TYR-LYS-LYS-LEU-LYS-ARG-GLU-MET-THR-PHE [Influenza A virus (A/chicken/China/028/2014(H7N9))]5WXC_E Chain E, H7-25-F [Influenza A virus (A/chicken/China/028/2014(H7N9))]5WXC_F Chain F, H7-25-F [Influenza A virus (A/chicken/China/028/2014(H7N9))]5WXD_E Chain E